MSKRLLKLVHEACGLKLLRAILISEIKLAHCVQESLLQALTVWDSVTLLPCSQRCGALKLWNWRLLSYNNIWKNLYKNHSGQVHR